MKLPVSYSDVFNVNKHNFNEIALQIFRYQYEENEVYRDYLQHISCDVSSITSIDDIPFLPIEFFKSHNVQSGDWKHASGDFFESSSTTGINTSKHYLKDYTWYEQSFIKGFEQTYGPTNDYCILALLPNYMDNKNSSLIAMVNRLIALTNNKNSGFYLNETNKMSTILNANQQVKQKTILFGVSFALLDCEFMDLEKCNNLTIIETGGMKGRRKEITRQELHSQIASKFPGADIHSEYGMTELFSQAYMTENLRFNSPPWMRVLTYETDDPFTKTRTGKSGLINVIDLANVETCSFIATSDIGKVYKDGSFEVLGRYDLSEQRGCNLLIA